MGTKLKLTWQTLFFYIVTLIFITQIIAFIAGIDGRATAICYGTWGTIAGATATIMVVLAAKKKINGDKEDKS